MSKYKVGDKFIINIKEVLESEKGTLYRANYNTLAFDDYGLDGLQKYDALQERLELIDELKQSEYNKGMNDGRNEAWELAQKLEFDEIDGGMSIDECGKIFECSVYDVFKYYTPQEALAKLKAYEEQRNIEVGDIVLIYGEEAVVTRVVDEHANILFGDGVTNNMPVKELVGDKTGKHIEIKSFLKQIGE